ncbi:hypothetical protein [Aureivirga sp. CE67]|uniref:hypothetical protein n=1 Tax=Aureivirga sp. CE67 TaxID=1788983 RepID=UPI0018C91316|nr:hypothetical protein [Aureivirga sp. CE67]
MSFKKITTLIFSLLISIVSFGQISLGKILEVNPKKTKSEIFERFKKTTTVFVLSDIYEKDKYDKILKEVWTITPYKLVRETDFKDKDYYLGDFSIVKLESFAHSFGMRTQNIRQNLYIYLDIFFYENEADLKEISKKKKTKEEILKNLKKLEKEEIAQIILSPKMEYITAISNSGTTEEDLYQLIYNDDFALNNSLGFFKNNLQKFNSIIENEEQHSLYKKTIESSELKKLTTETLYISKNGENHFMDFKNRPSGPIPSLEDMEKVFTNYYKFPYEIIPHEDLDQKILNNEPFYYLRFSYDFNITLLQIVNAQTGDIIYSRHHLGTFYIVHQDQVKDLSKAIKKASK